MQSFDQLFKCANWVATRFGGKNETGKNIDVAKVLDYLPEIIIIFLTFLLIGSATLTKSTLFVSHGQN